MENRTRSFSSASAIGAQIQASVNQQRRQYQGALESLLGLFGKGQANRMKVWQQRINSKSYRTRDVLLAVDWYKHDQGPLIVESGGQRFLMLYQGKGYQGFDLENLTTPCHFSKSQFAKVKPQAQALYRAFDCKAIDLKTLWTWAVMDLKNEMCWLLTLAVLASGLGLCVPLMTGYLVDKIIPQANLGQLETLVFGLGVVLLGQVFFKFTLGLTMLRTETHMSQSVQSAVWQRLLDCPMAFFKEFSTGDLAQRANGIDQIRQILTGSVMSTCLSCVFACFNFILLFYYSPLLASYALAVLLVGVGFYSVCQYQSINLARRKMAQQGKVASFSFQLLQGLEKLHASGATMRAFSQWMVQFTGLSSLDLKVMKINNAMAIFQNGYLILSSVGLFVMIAWVNKHQGASMSIGHFIAFSAAFGMLIHAGLSLTTTLLNLGQIVPLYERAKPILTTVPERQGGALDIALQGNIDINSVVFRYEPSSPIVLNELSCQIKAGEFVAIVGESGCGKSTVFRLLLGFETPTRGAIFYDNHPLTQLHKQRLRQQMGVVMQSASLVGGDIVGNIRAGSNLDLEQVWQAAELAGLAQDIRQMPMGMHTVVSESATNLSGGQKQRLLIARALASKPTILLFDEATSALDNVTQAIVTESLNALNITRLVIAHRLTTIKDADMILVLEQGKIVEKGNYEALMSQRGRFWSLAQAQLA